MTEIQIVEAPFALKESIKFHTFQTYEEHRARQPFAFSQNQFKLNIEPDIDASFLDTNGKPRASSDNIFAAMLGDTFCGYILLSSGGKTTWPRVNINAIFVVDSFRGQGIGRLLLEHAKALSKTNNWDNLTAQVWHGNAASYALFRACGFAPQSEFLRFGPETQARDYPMPPRAAKPSRFNKWLFNVILPLSIIVSISVLAESISRIWQSR